MDESAGELARATSPVALSRDLAEGFLCTGRGGSQRDNSVPKLICGGASVTVAQRSFHVQSIDRTLMSECVQRC